MISYQNLLYIFRLFHSVHHDHKSVNAKVANQLHVVERIILVLSANFGLKVHVVLNFLAVTRTKNLCPAAFVSFFEICFLYAIYNHLLLFEQLVSVTSIEGRRTPWAGVVEISCRLSSTFRAVD